MPESENRQQTVFQLYEKIKHLPTPRQEFKHELVITTGKSPLTVATWLVGGNIPNPQDQQKIADKLGVCLDELFPHQETDSPKSLASMYHKLSNRNERLLDLEYRIAEVTSVSLSTVRRWLCGKRVPKEYQQRLIAIELTDFKSRDEDGMDADI